MTETEAGEVMAAVHQLMDATVWGFFSPRWRHNPEFDLVGWSGHVTHWVRRASVLLPQLHRHPDALRLLASVIRDVRLVTPVIGCILCGGEQGVICVKRFTPTGTPSESRTVRLLLA